MKKKSFAPWTHEIVFGWITRTLFCIVSYSCRACSVSEFRIRIRVRRDVPPPCTRNFILSDLRTTTTTTTTSSSTTTTTTTSTTSSSSTSTATTPSAQDHTTGIFSDSVLRVLSRTQHSRLLSYTCQFKKFNGYGTILGVMQCWWRHHTCLCRTGDVMKRGYLYISDCFYPSIVVFSAYW